MSVSKTDKKYLTTICKKTNIELTQNNINKTYNLDFFFDTNHTNVNDIFTFDFLFNLLNSLDKANDFIESTHILNKYNDNLDKIRLKIDEQNINFYIDYIVNSLFEANKYFNDQEPWKKKDDLTRLNTIVYTTLEIVRKISFLLYPIIPGSSQKALKIFDIEENKIKLHTITNNEYLTKGNNLNKIDILFKKIEKNND